MPIYEYRCKSCDKRFEVLIRSSEQGNPVCPVCKKEVERIFSAFRFSKAGKFISSSSKTSCTGCTSNSCEDCGN